MKLYEDQLVLVELPEKLATAGHLRVVLKKSVSSLAELSNHEREHAYYAATFAASVLFETLGAVGTNIVVHDGVKPLALDVIAQTEKESVNLLWEPQTIPENEMKELAAKIKDKCDYIGVPKKSKEPLQLDKVEKIDEKSIEKKEETEKKENVEEENKKYKILKKNYLLDQLKRRA